MINDFKDVEKLLKLCRKQGVFEVTFGEMSFKLGELPNESGKIYGQETDPVDPYKNFPTGDLTPKQLMFYSSGGLPENDPDLIGGSN